MEKQFAVHLSLMTLLKLTLSVCIGTIILACNHSGQAASKRPAPKDITPLVYNNILLTAPINKMGCIVAIDTANHSVLWEKEVYHIRQNPFLESDVQDVFIDSIFLRDNLLIIRNEQNKKFALDLETRDAKEL
jgi:hypothetical protein